MHLDVRAVGEQVAARRNLEDPVERGPARRRHQAVVHVEERLAVPAERHSQSGERLHLRRDVAGAVHHRVVERLDPEPVAGGKQHAVALVPDRERELAAQVVQALRAEVLVQVQRDLAVRSSPEAMPLGLQAAADRLEVVELAVDDDVERLVFVGDRLIAGGQVDDAQPRVSEARTPVRGGPGCLVVRAPMNEAPRGGENAVRRDATPTGYRRDDTAHAGDYNTRNEFCAIALRAGAGDRGTLNPTLRLPISYSPFPICLFSRTRERSRPRSSQGT